MPTPRSPVLGTSPCLVVSDLAASIAFYRDALGYRDAEVWGEPPCFAMLHRDGFDLMLSLAERPDLVRPNGPHGVWDFYIRIADARAEAVVLRARGVDLAREPEQTAYDMLEFEVLDPDGYRICFGQPLEAA